MAPRTAILEQIIEPQEGNFSSEHARYVLSLHFPSHMQHRYAQLAEKVQLNTLSADERSELNQYLDANALLMILKSKARVSIQRHGSAA